MGALSTGRGMLLRGRRGCWGERGETGDVDYGKTGCADVVTGWRERSRGSSLSATLCSTVGRM